MLGVMLSHWAIYFFVAYVLTLLVLVYIYREHPLRIYRRVRLLPSRIGRAALLPWHRLT